MKPVFLHFLKGLSIVLALLYVGGCVAGYVHPAHFWPFTFLALGFPVLACLLIVYALGWLFLSRRMALLLCLAWLAGFQSLRNVFALNIGNSFEVIKDTNTLRILSWNVRGFDNNNRSAEHPDSARRRMINFIKQQQADVLLLQEFVEYHYPSIYSNTQTLSDTLGFKYHYTSKDITLQMSYGPLEVGSAIFSKFPLHDTIKLNYSGLPVPENAIGATIVYKGRKLNVFTTHLISMNLSKGPLARQDDAYKEFDSAFIYGASKVAKLKHYDQVHSNQAIQLKRWMEAAAQPYIVSGDFNSVPSSYAYHTIKGGLHDAFVKKGFGIGRTYGSLSPTLRIDYILADQQLEVLHYNCPKLYLSDHFPLVADVKWR